MPVGAKGRPAHLKAAILRHEKRVLPVHQINQQAHCASLGVPPNIVQAPPELSAVGLLESSFVLGVSAVEAERAVVPADHLRPVSLCDGGAVSEVQLECAHIV